MFFVPILSIELIDFNDYDVAKIAVGSYLQFSTGTHLYGLIHYNDYDNDDGDFSLTAGFSHTLTDNLDVNVSWVEYTDRDGLDGAKVSVGYYFHQNFSVSANYQALDAFNIMSVAARLSF